MPQKTAAKTPAKSEEVLLDSHVANRRFTFHGRVFLPGEPITIDVYRHPRFEALLRNGMVKEAR